jgi:hypothetical protein
MDQMIATHLMVDGTLSDPLRRLIALGGTPEMLALAEANGQVAFWTEMARGQGRAIRARWAEGTMYPEMRDDLALYLRSRRKWQRIAADLRRVVAVQLAARTAAETQAA